MKRYRTTIFSAPDADLIGFRALEGDYTTEPRRYSLPAVVSKGGGKLARPFLHRLGLFFSRKRKTEQHQYESPFL